MIAGHALSRVPPVLTIFTSEYSRDDATSKTKPIGKKSKTSDLIIAVIFGILPIAILPPEFTLYIIPVLLFTTYFFRNYITKKLGGYTGDCLGALQQISEVEIYLGFVIYLSFQSCC